jgi:hypothetical protein
MCVTPHRKPRARGTTEWFSSPRIQRQPHYTSRFLPPCQSTERTPSSDATSGSPTSHHTGNPKVVGYLSSKAPRRGVVCAHPSRQFPAEAGTTTRPHVPKTYSAPSETHSDVGGDYWPPEGRRGPNGFHGVTSRFVVKTNPQGSSPHAVPPSSRTPSPPGSSHTPAGYPNSFTRKRGRTHR